MNIHQGPSVLPIPSAGTPATTATTATTATPAVTGTVSTAGTSMAGITGASPTPIPAMTPAEHAQPSGNTLPPAEASAGTHAAQAHSTTHNPDAQQPNDSTLLQAVDNANAFVQAIQRDLHFSIDEDTDRTVVKVVESSSGDIIRQIPNESFLELARKMKELGEVSLVNATG